MIQQRRTSPVLSQFLTYGTVQVRVLGQVSHQRHRVSLQVDLVGFQKGADNLHAVQFLHDGLAHDAGDLSVEQLTP